MKYHYQCDINTDNITRTIDFWLCDESYDLAKEISETIALFYGADLLETYFISKEL